MQNVNSRRNNRENIKGRSRVGIWNSYLLNYSVNLKLDFFKKLPPQKKKMTVGVELSRNPYIHISRVGTVGEHPAKDFQTSLGQNLLIWPRQHCWRVEGPENKCS